MDLLKQVQSFKNHIVQFDFFNGFKLLLLTLFQFIVFNARAKYVDFAINNIGSLFVKSVTKILQIYTTDFTMLSTVHEHSTINKMTITTADITDGSNMQNRAVAEDDCIILDGADGTSVNPSCVIAASLKDAFDDASSHMFLSSDVSSLFNTAKSVACFL